MAFYSPHGLGSRYKTFLRCHVQDEGLPFAKALTELQIEQAARAENLYFGADEGCVYTPAMTTWAFVGQYLSVSTTCVTAVARVMVLMVALGREPCSPATGAYCKARAKLPEAFLRRLTGEVGNGVEDEAPDSWRWRNRRTLLVDGFETILDDTEANQHEYPQPKTQKPGLGFPMIRVVVLLAVATAVIIDAAMGPYAGKKTGETALFRQLIERLRQGDIVVADRYYCSYFMIALLQQRGVDATFRLHQKRRYDFRGGERLGRNDHIVVWHRPQRPTWMDEATYAAIPETMRIRETRFAVDEPGYRSKEIIVATTLLDHDTYSPSDIADLYHQRWQAELDIRSIKTTLGMEMIHCKTPAMSRKAIWAHLLGYNLVRKTAAQAAWQKSLTPRQISFAGALQTLETFRWLLIAGADDQMKFVYRVLLDAIATHRVGSRPGRVEPRRIKRRRDRYQKLGKPRAQARQAAMNGQQ